MTTREQYQFACRAMRQGTALSAMPYTHNVIIAAVVSSRPICRFYRWQDFERGIRFLERAP